LSVALSIQLFAAGKQLTGQHAPSTSPALAPDESQKKFVVPEGFEVRLFAAEPDVINPVAMTWDERGRLWVLELYEYPLGAPAGQKGRDRIKILEDTDGDGRADKVTIFADGLNLATGLALGNGGVYVGQAPDLLFLRDTNHDDHADTREVLLTGFGLNDRHELLNGFTWGPDGWLYMTHGVFNKSVVKIPEATTPGIEMSAAVARFDPRTRKFEIFADGTSNPWGVDFDRYGNAFVSACVIDHLFHMTPGGIYQRQGGTPANPYSYELLPSIVDHKHYMAAYCGICIYQGNNFPAEYQGHVFMGNIHQNAINHDRLIPNGSSFKAVAEKDFLTTSDGWFRPISEQVGPDGALWIADWYDKYPCYQNAQADPEGVDRERGRIWRVVYVGNEKGKKIPTRPDLKMDMSKLGPTQLADLLEHSNIWHRRTAQKVLIDFFRSRVPKANADYYGDPTPDAVRLTLFSILNQRGWFDKVFRQQPPHTRLAALWGLNNLFSLNGETLQQLSTDQEPSIRVWIARIIGEGRKVSRDNLSILEKLANDSDPSVRLAVATAIRQLVSSSLTVDSDINTNVPIGKILGALIKSSADAKDPLLPFMIWMAGEPTFAKNPKGGLQWLAENGAGTMPLSGILARKSMRRICDTGEPEKINQAVEFLTTIAAQVTGTSAQVVGTPAQVVGTPAQVVGTPAQFAGTPAQVVGTPAQVAGTSAQVAETPSQVGGVSSQGLLLAALDGLIEAQRGKAFLPTVDTKALFAKLDSINDAQIKERAHELGTLWGDTSAVAAELALINDAKASVEDRAKAIVATTQLKSDAAREAMLKLIAQETGRATRPRGQDDQQVVPTKNPDALVIEALRALSALGGGDKIGAEIITHWKDFTPGERRTAADVLVSRHSWTEEFLNAVQDKTILPTEISASVFRAISNYKDANFDARAQKLLGRFRESSADKIKIIREKRKMILSDEPDLNKGHEVAKKTCFVCHKLYGEGAEIGPDLTGVGRSTLDALLANVIDPNQVVGKGYENVMIETKDGRSVSGRLVEDTDSHVKLISAGPKEDVIAKSDIESRRVSELSVMPEGLEQMPEEDFRNLIWFILNPPQDNRPMTHELRKQLIGK